MRKAGISREAVEEIAVAPDEIRVDRHGNPIAVGKNREVGVVRIVIALDDPGYVITVIVKRKHR